MKTDLGIGLIVFATAMVMVGCRGEAGDGSHEFSNGGAGMGKTVECKTDASLASARISLLTTDQYINVVRDVFGVDFVPDSVGANTGDYSSNDAAAVGSVEVAQNYYYAADQVASKVKPCG